MNPTGNTDANASLSWKLIVGLSVWVVLGWSWWIVDLLEKPAASADEQARAQKAQRDEALAGDVHSALGQLIRVPERFSELATVPVRVLKPGAYCDLAWTDEDELLVFPGRSADKTPAVGWLNVTVDGKTVTGRYTMKLASGYCDVRPGVHDRECTKIKGIQLVERLQLPAAPAGWTPILPGQCVLGAFDDSAPGIVGRYIIELPADRTITVYPYSIPATVFLSTRLSLNGVEVPSLPGQHNVFRSPARGSYQLTVETMATTAVESSRYQGEYSLQVHWGRSVGPRCSIPSLDHHGCYGPAAPARAPKPTPAAMPRPTPAPMPTTPGPPERLP